MLKFWFPPPTSPRPSRSASILRPSSIRILYSIIESKNRCCMLCLSLLALGRFTLTLTWNYYYYIFLLLFWSNLVHVQIYILLVKKIHGLTYQHLPPDIRLWLPLLNCLYFAYIAYYSFLSAEFLLSFCFHFGSLSTVYNVI